jgi:hypothetical protein
MNREIKTITVNLFDSTNDCNGCLLKLLSGNLKHWKENIPTALINRFQDIIMNPKSMHYDPNISIDMDEVDFELYLDYYDYDCARICIDATYQRLETDEEMNKRIQRSEIAKKGWETRKKKS